MRSSPSRRTLLRTACVAATVSGIGVRPVAAERESATAVIYEDGFSDDTRTDYEVDHRPSEAASESGAPGDVSWSASEQCLTVRSPADVLTVVRPGRLKVPSSGHVHVRFDVTEANADAHALGLRLVEDDDRWVEFGLAGDGFAVVDHDDGGESRYSELGVNDPSTGRHSVDVFWGPDERAVYFDGEFNNSSRPQDGYDFAPRSLQFRNVQADTRLLYWRLDDAASPAGNEDLETSSTPTGPSTTSEPPTDRPTEPPTPEDPDRAGVSARRTPTPSGYDWLEGWAPLLAGVVAVPVVGPLVLGGLLLARRLVARQDD